MEYKTIFTDCEGAAKIEDISEQLDLLCIVDVDRCCYKVTAHTMVLAEFAKMGA